MEEGDRGLTLKGIMPCIYDDTPLYVKLVAKGTCPGPPWHSVDEQRNRKYLTITENLVLHVKLRKEGEIALPSMIILKP